MVTPEAAINNSTPSKKKRTYQLSAFRFPYYTLADSVAAAKAVHDRGGGLATRDQLAAFLDYSSTNNGAYLNRVAAAKLFGLIISEGSQFRFTPRAAAILMPSYPEDAQRALAEAFLDVPLFKAVYEECKGQQLPNEFGLKNLLRLKFSVGQSVVDTAVRTLMSSAEDAGFFATRGSRTHLIMPAVAPAALPPERSTEDTDNSTEADVHGGGGGGNNYIPPPQSREELQNSYVATLIELLREKGKQGEVDAELMTRIEKLLALA